MNTLKVCDHSASNGTARALLLVAGGGTWQLFDDNGALSPCTTSARLNVNEDRWATLYICENSSNETCL